MVRACRTSSIETHSIPKGGGANKFEEEVVVGMEEVVEEVKKVAALE
jgi:hypothetical protein